MPVNDLVAAWPFQGTVVDFGLRDATALLAAPLPVGHRQPDLPQANVRARVSRGADT